MNIKQSTNPVNVLVVLLLAYAAASLFHHIHNAEFLSEYPNMPVWLTRARVYAAWIGVTAVGLGGYLLIRFRHQAAGLLVTAIYGLLGLDGLGHYALAPMSAHSMAMNASIWLEVVTAILLLMAVAVSMVRRLRG